MPANSHLVYVHCALLPERWCHRLAWVCSSESWWRSEEATPTLVSGILSNSKAGMTLRRGLSLQYLGVPCTLYILCYRRRQKYKTTPSLEGWHRCELLSVEIKWVNHVGRFVLQIHPTQVLTSNAKWHSMVTRHDDTIVAPNCHMPMSNPSYDKTATKKMTRLCHSESNITIQNWLR